MAGGGSLALEGVPNELKLELSDEEKVLLGLGVGVGLTLGGIVLFWDDIKDIPHFSTERHISPLHHWWLGLLLFLAGLVVLGITAIYMVAVLARGER